MPESVTDRCTKSHEYLFLLSKKQRYYYDNEAVKEAVSDVSLKRSEYGWDCDRPSTKNASGGKAGIHTAKMGTRFVNPSGRNRRTIWTIPTRGYSGAHFATFPPALVMPCILAGASAKGVCPECGAPWERVVEKTGGTIGQSWHDHTDDTGKGMTQTQEGIPLATWKEQQERQNPYTVTTIGWRPTCECSGYGILPDPPTQTKTETDLEYTERLDWWECQAAELLPIYETLPKNLAIVSDIFCGSGTVGEVCNETGRKFVGLDLSSSYLRDLALPRAENKCTTESVMELPMFALDDTE